MRRSRVVMIGMALLLVMYILSGCGSGEKSEESTTLEPSSVEAVLPEEFSNQDSAAGENSKKSSDNNYLLETRKLIRRVQMTLQTTEFDKTMNLISIKIDETGGYVESSQITGKSYDYKGDRSSYIVARIPSDKLNRFLDASEDFGNVINKSENIEDVTMQYTDTEARRKSLQIEFDRLLALIDRADKLEDIIKLEERLSQVRYQMDSLTAQLKVLENQVNYSTVSMEIHEVQLLTPSEKGGMLDRIKNGFMNSLYSLRTGLENLIVGFVVAIPYLVILAVVILLLFWINKKVLKKRFNKEDK
ncbi:MAG: DUF4349 domain-containing protein [Proteocatella sp.]